MELRMGRMDSTIGGVFFIVITQDVTYIWEDMSDYVEFLEEEEEEEEEGPSAKWCLWPKKWMPLRETHPCSKLTFLLVTGHDFEQTARRDITHRE